MILYIVATPIGNLEDITLRALRILKEVDFILSEDTRVTKKLLNHFEITGQLISFHEYSEKTKFEKILNLLQEGKKIALVTDAGTPAISDPGAYLVKEIRENLPEVKIIPIPGASALITLLSVAGAEKKEFTFLGFPPHKKGRKTFFEKVAQSDRPIIFYESTHRIIKALESLQEECPDRKVILGKELTKIYEEVILGKPFEILEYFSLYPKKIKGEFVVLVE